MAAAQIPATGTTADTNTTAAGTGTGTTDAAGRHGAPRGSSHGTARKVLWTLQILIALFLVVASALPKLVGEQNAVETFELIGWGQWFRYVTGVVELAGGIGLLIPRLAGAAATGLIGLMAGAALTQILVIEPAWALLPVAFGAVLALVARDRREQTRALVRSLSLSRSRRR
ncbi:doxX family protein [Planomonospora sphaerica]|uniref:DoxX family protein n=1 Tax=Planomonospora sphaerica TaxID=161355 RepID=A0A171DNY4_9ACTN|nr:DoxX family protein [Planomonospora sphaerica]GAT70770.1 doxX family protein [Planomonospora sphaerica]